MSDSLRALASAWTFVWHSSPAQVEVYSGGHLNILSIFLTCQSQYDEWHSAAPIGLAGGWQVAAGGELDTASCGLAFGISFPGCSQPPTASRSLIAGILLAAHFLLPASGRVAASCQLFTTGYWPCSCIPGT
jgi:hypothetical protein